MTARSPCARRCNCGRARAGALAGTVLPVAVILPASGYAPVLYQVPWALLMGGVVIACALGGTAFTLCAAGLRDLRLMMGAEQGPVPRRARAR